MRRHAGLLLTASLLLGACESRGPVVVELVARDQGECDGFMPAVEAAAHFWSDRGVDVEVGECVVRDFDGDVHIVGYDDSDPAVGLDFAGGGPFRTSRTTLRFYAVDSVYVELRDGRDRHAGGMQVHGGGRGGCVNVGFLTEPSVQLATHEMGHAFGLAHVDDIDNVMHPSAPVGDATDEQDSDATWFAAEFVDICGV